MGGKEPYYKFSKPLRLPVKAKVITWKYLLMNWPVLENIPSYKTVLIHSPLSESLWHSVLIDLSNIVQEQVEKLQHEVRNFIINARLLGIYVNDVRELPELHAKPLINEDLAVRHFKENWMVTG